MHIKKCNKLLNIPARNIYEIVISKDRLEELLDTVCGKSGTAFDKIFSIEEVKFFSKKGSNYWRYLLLVYS